MRNKKYRYGFGCIVNNFEILEKIIIHIKNKHCKSGYTNVNGYNVKCLKCGYVHDMTENKINKNVGCGCCSNKVCVKGINDIATTHPHLLRYFVNKEDADTCTFGSAKKILTMCPDCGFKKCLTPNKLNKNGFGCKVCSDGISYPEKFVSNLLNQNNVLYNRELILHRKNRSDNYRYDFYLCDYDTIIEVHGLQHYEKPHRGRSLKEEQKNDELKICFALEKGISNYIVLDCRKSELEWIKASVMNSELPKLLSFKECDIDWEECSNASMKSIMIKVCNCWKSKKETDSTTTFANDFGVSSNTILSYLKRGSEIGICEYDAQEEIEKGKERFLNSSRGAKKIMCQELIGVFGNGVFESSMDAVNKLGKVGVKIHSSSICENANGIRKSAGKYNGISLTWRHV